ncbi:MAG: 4-hydroxy-tetrahydrodipicolinate synthase [Bacteroidales bacterium]|nr:4-hydroxy-tetrahydrodipicolinate synthase [Bacteroidales bacterium]HOI31367.1 4-hydroxy-tetrahydrodipicolinate synthase [Bacteroidales bacterium]
MTDHLFCGTGVALVTPFEEDGNVDVASLHKLVDHTLNNGVDFLVALGTTSEAPTLSLTEKALVVNTIMDAASSRKKVMLGVGGNNTQAVLDQLATGIPDGVAGILSVVPYYNKPQQKGIMEHFKAIADKSPVPVILYNVPGRTAANMTAETCLELAQHPNIIGVKEASGDLQQIMTIINHKPDDFAVLSGDDALTFPMIALGAAGVISVAANAFCKEFSAMVSFSRAGRIEDASRLHYQMLDRMSLLFAEGNPAGVKALLEIMGICGSKTRLPLVEASDQLKAKLKEEFISNQN